MYFVDRQKIAQTLVYMNRLLDTFNREKWESAVEQLALERLAQNLIESVIDVGNQMIDGFIMRDPGGYEDIIDILEDESVLPQRDAAAIKEVIRFRKMLVQHYMDVDHKALQRTIAEHWNALKRFSEHVQKYLETELGPLSAFMPNDKTRG
ncbi:DUF86 domain-containing protein [Sporolactobacillus sp. THM7-7]|nr:DUF86 domain-containing protein [Sporolactobacillus sp. THM7-7]